MNVLGGGLHRRQPRQRRGVGEIVELETNLVADSEELIRRQILVFSRVTATISVNTLANGRNSACSQLADLLAPRRRRWWQPSTLSIAAFRSPSAALAAVSSSAAPVSV